MSFLSFNKNKSDNLSDLDLIEKYLKTNDFGNIQILFERYTALIYGLSLKYLNDAPLAKDMVIEIYASLPDKLQKHTIQNFKSWIYKVSKNHILNYLRKEKRRVEKENDVKSVYFDSEMHHIDEDIFSIKMDILDKCLERLNENQKLCIDLFYYKKKSYREIVEQTDMVLGKIRSLIQNGRRNLKICIEKHYE